MADNTNTNGFIGRTVPLDLGKLLSLLAELGWTNADLALKVGVSSRTIERIVKRRTASRKVYAEILQAIQYGIREKRKRTGIVDDNVEHPHSLERTCDLESDDHASSGGTSTLTLADTAFVEITIDGDFNSFSQEKQNKYLDVIQAFLKSANRPKVMQIRRGSIKMTLLLAPNQAEQLIWGIKGGEYESIGIVDATLVESDKKTEFTADKRTELRERSNEGTRAFHRRNRTKRSSRSRSNSVPVPQQESLRYFAWKWWPTRLVGALLLIFATPAILLLAVLIRLTSSGPAIYRQTRIGRHGKEFAMYMLRTMYVDVISMSGPTWYRPGDHRITPVGKLLQMLHLHELPQLINIVKGDMDLVGPRPERPAFFEFLSREIPDYSDRLRVLPGITGLAQVNLPPDETLECVRRRLVLDCEYIQTANMWLDVRILICEFLQMLGVRHHRAASLLGVTRRVHSRDASHKRKSHR